MQQKQNNKSSRKYLLSLLYTLKDLLLILKSGIIEAFILNILMYAVFKEPFDVIGCLAYIICGGSIGIVIELDKNNPPLSLLKSFGRVVLCLYFT